VENLLCKPQNLVFRVRDDGVCSREGGKRIEKLTGYPQWNLGFGYEKKPVRKRAGLIRI
jgi:hypothetical protein